MPIDKIDLIIRGLTFLIILAGVIIALKNLSVIAKTRKLGVINSFLEELQSSEDSRRYIFQKFQFETIGKLSKKDIEEAEKVVNSLNRICLLLDSKLVNGKVVFGLCHTVIIRCEYKLKGFISENEKMIGGRYGRRTIGLTNRAKKYHDSYKKHRCMPINMYTGEGNSIQIYNTIISKSLYKRYAQKFEWFWRRLWRKF